MSIELQTKPRLRTSETSLFYAYRNDPAVLALRDLGREKVRRPCVCRGHIEADPSDPAPGVQAHNETRQHARWREDNEL
jgi:hypothetical protein